MVERRRHRDLVYFYMPDSESEVGRLSDRVVMQLVAHPDKLGEFMGLVKDKMFLESAVGGKDLTKKFLSQVVSGVEDYEWGKRRGDDLTVKAAGELLACLPELDQGDTKRDGDDLGRLAQGMMRGFLERRFEGSHDWRGYTRTTSTLVKAAVEEGVDSGLFGKLFDLMTGRYDQIMQPEGFGWRAFFVGNRAVASRDERYLEMATDTLRCMAIMVELLGKNEEAKVAGDRYAKLNIQYDSLATLFGMGLNPNESVGKTMYENLIRMGVDEKRRGENSLGQAVTAEDIVRLKISPEIWEVAAQHGHNLKRGIALDMMTRKFGWENSEGDIQKMTIPEDPGSFPYSVVSKVSKEREILMSLLDSSTIRRRLREYADGVVKVGGNKWSVTPFAIDGFAGYVIGDQDKTGIRKNIGPKEEAIAVRSFLEQQQIRQEMSDNFPESSLSVDAGHLMGDGFEVLLIPESRSLKSKEETVLDIQVPERLRSRSIEILGEVIKMRLSIPREFTQMPTRSGYQFHLEDNLDLPGVFGESLVRLDEMGGMEVQITPVDTDRVGKQQRLRPLVAKVTFPSHRMKIEWGDLGSKLPLDLQWIAESVALSLIKSVVCIPLNETEHPRPGDFVPEEGEVGKNSIPGRVGHVGGFRLSGERKQFTQIAEAKFQEAMRIMGVATGGLSLAEINLEHKSKHPECERSLTWYSGYEPEILPAPVIRKAPDRLVTID